MDLWETIKRIYMPEFLLCRRPTQGNSWTQVFEGNVGNTAWPHYFKTTMINNKEKTLTSIANLNKSVTSNEKVIQQRKAQDQMASLNWYWLFSVIQNTKENFCQSIPPDQNQPDTQIRQKHKSKKKLIFLTSKDIKKKKLHKVPANQTRHYTWKITHNQVRFIPEMPGQFNTSKSTEVLNHTSTEFKQKSCNHHDRKKQKPQGTIRERDILVWKKTKKQKNNKRHLKRFNIPS